MNKKTYQGTICILFETDMAKSVPLDENSLSELEKRCLSLFNENEHKNILAGQRAKVIDIESETVICDFNKNTYHLPKYAAESMARAFLPLIQEYYSNEENVKTAEEWAKQQAKNKKKRNNP